MTSASDWTTSSQRFLREATKKLLEQIAFYQTPEVEGPYPLDFPEGAAGTAFEHVCAAFELSDFERKVLLLAAADELHPTLLRRCCAFEMDLNPHTPLQAYLTPFVLTRWYEDADVRAFQPERTLMRCGLVRLLPPLEVASSESLRPLQLTPGAFGFLMGNTDALEKVPFTGGAEQLWTAGQVDTYDRLLDLYSRTWSEHGEVPTVALYGDVQGARLVVEVLAGPAGLRVRHVVLDEALLAVTPTEFDVRVADLVRESTLGGGVLLLELPPGSSRHAQEEPGTPAAATRPVAAVLREIVECGRGPVVIASEEPLALDLNGPTFSWEVPFPRVAERRALWVQALNLPTYSLTREEEGQLDQLASHFCLPYQKVLRVMGNVQTGLAALPTGSPSAAQVRPDAILARAWHECRQIGRATMARVRHLAQHLPSEATWNDLILPEADVATLNDMALHVAYRGRVQSLYARDGARGGGIAALFSGPSGTGKTFAAQVLANALALDLYRVDLSSLTSKWLGETEKNLRAVFDAADESGAILLFDEADSVFGRRGDGGDAQGRYANMQTNYLLQRLESYQGLVILTSNLPSSIDSAFLRRIRFELHFQEPSLSERRRLWQRAFPGAVQVEHLDFDRLASAKLTGANIKSIALHAVYTAIARGSAVDQALVEEAATREMRKLGRLTVEFKA